MTTIDIVYSPLQKEKPPNSQAGYSLGIFAGSAEGIGHPALPQFDGEDVNSKTAWLPGSIQNKPRSINGLMATAHQAAAVVDRR